MTQTNYFGHGMPRKVARLCGERRHNGAGGFWDILSQSSIAEFVLTSPKAGFGEALQQAFLQPAGMQKWQVWLHLPCLPLVRPPEPPRKNGGSAVSYAPSVSRFSMIALIIPSTSRSSLSLRELSRILIRFFAASSALISG